jgi:OOP family OmpA-OmpF porin
MKQREKCSSKGANPAIKKIISKEKMKKIILPLILAVTSTAYAHDNWISGSGQVVKSGTGLCWRNAGWTPATAASECDGALKPAPKAQAPQPQATVPVAIPAPKAQAPQPQPLPQPVVTKTTYQTDTLFDFDKSVIKPEGKQVLDELVTKLKTIKLEVIIVVGHTDSIGTDAYNMKLGGRRADAVQAYLISKGVEKSRVYVESKGEKQPVADNKTAAGRAKNRRVEVEVVGNK